MRQLYTIDNNNWFPQWTSEAAAPGGDHDTNYMWGRVIADYVNYKYTRGPELFHCPADYNHPNLPLYQLRSYEMNRYPGSNYDGDGSNSVITRIKHPSKLALIMELKREDNLKYPRTMNDSLNYWCRLRSDGVAGSTYTEAYAYRHQGLSLNILFPDGHVENAKRNFKGYPGEGVIRLYLDGVPLYF
jgi:prepilin-type processing-associated H-X9-DG protein